MFYNPNNFVLTGWAHEHVVDTTGIGELPGHQGFVMPDITPDITFEILGAVWKTCDKQALIRAESMTEQLARVKAPPSTNGS
jgi:hypothetical protein